MQQVASYLNDKVHDLSSNVIAKYDEAPGESCGFELEQFVSCIFPDLWEMIVLLTLSKYLNRGRKQSESLALYPGSYWEGGERAWYALFKRALNLNVNLHVRDICGCDVA